MLKAALWNKIIAYLFYMTSRDGLKAGIAKHVQHALSPC